jgi:hypothetical protein
MGVVWNLAGDGEEDFHVAGVGSQFLETDDFTMLAGKFYGFVGKYIFSKATGPYAIQDDPEVVNNTDIVDQYFPELFPEQFSMDVALTGFHQKTWMLDTRLLQSPKTLPLGMDLKIAPWREIWFAVDVYMKMFGALKTLPMDLQIKAEKLADVAVDLKLVSPSVETWTWAFDLLLLLPVQTIGLPSDVQLLRLGIAKDFNVDLLISYVGGLFITGSGTVIPALMGSGSVVACLSGSGEVTPKV